MFLSDFENNHGAWDWETKHHGFKGHKAASPSPQHPSLLSAWRRVLLAQEPGTWWEDWPKRKVLREGCKRLERKQLSQLPMSLELTWSYDYNWYHATHIQARPRRKANRKKWLIFAQTHLDKPKILLGKCSDYWWKQKRGLLQCRSVICLQRTKISFYGKEHPS